MKKCTDRLEIPNDLWAAFDPIPGRKHASKEDIEMLELKFEDLSVKLDRIFGSHALVNGRWVDLFPKQRGER